VYIPLPNTCTPSGSGKPPTRASMSCAKSRSHECPGGAEAIQYAERKGVRVMEAFMYRSIPVETGPGAGHAGRSDGARGLHGVLLHAEGSDEHPQHSRRRRRGLPDIGATAVSCARFLLGREPIRVMSLVQRDPG